MRVLVTGGTGFIGQTLCPRLSALGHEVVILSRQSPARLPNGVAAVVTALEPLDPSEFGAIINLAGAPIGDSRWTESRKRLLFNSRITTTSRLIEWLSRAKQPPQVLISGSAVGYYGEQYDRPVTEDTPPSPGFTHDLCAAWEREAQRAVKLGMRVCVMRMGVALDRDGGALAKMLPAFRLGAGGRLGSGRQFFPWIHREDVISICQWLLEQPQAHGAYNLAAPNPVTNADFSRALGHALGRPTLLPMPEAALRVLFGEMSMLLLASDRMLPQRLQQGGFEFRYPRLEAALAAIFPRPGPRGAELG
jgi:uncharacterized protein (TIGR01777 family)